MITELSNCEMQQCSGGTCTNKILSIASSCVGYTGTLGLSICAALKPYFNAIYAQDPVKLAAANAGLLLSSEIIGLTTTTASAVLSTIASIYPECNNTVSSANSFNDM